MNRDTQRRSALLVILSIVAVALAARLSPLLLSPLPYNTDAFVFVTRAEQIMRANHVAFTGPKAPYPDEYLFDTLLVAASELTGIAPLALVQGYVAALGVLPPLVAAALASRLAAGLGYSRVRTRAVALAAGLALAVEGLFLWRTVTVSSEVMGIGVVALLALALHRAFLTGRPAWAALATGFGVLLPIVHNGSTFVGGLVATVLVTAHVARDPTRKRVLLGLLGICGFWVVAFGYYELVELPNASEITAAPGLFIAWAVLFALAARWVETTGRRTQRALPVAAVGAGFLVFLANAFVPIFPGSATTSTALLALVGPLLLLTVFAAVALPDAATDRGAALVALFLGPLAAVAFGMTAGRTLDYQGLVTRSQTFAHIAVVALGAVGVARLASADRGRVIRVGAVILFAGAVLVTAPFPFVLAETGATPFKAVTTPAEFETANFASERVPGKVAADDHITHIGRKYRGGDVTDLPVFTWLGGGTPPGCPTVAQQSWTTSGAPAFPEPLTISEGAYNHWLTSNDVVYTAGGSDPLALVVSDGPGTCESVPTSSPRG